MSYISINVYIVPDDGGIVSNEYNDRGRKRYQPV